MEAPNVAHSYSCGGRWPSSACSLSRVARWPSVPADPIGAHHRGPAHGRSLANPPTGLFLRASMNAAPPGVAVGRTRRSLRSLCRSCPAATGSAPGRRAIRPGIPYDSLSTTTLPSELAAKETRLSSPEATMWALFKVIRSIPPEARRAWKSAESRVLNVGYRPEEFVTLLHEQTPGSGRWYAKDPRKAAKPSVTLLSPELLQAVARAGAASRRRFTRRQGRCRHPGRIHGPANRNCSERSTSLASLDRMLAAECLYHWADEMGLSLYDTSGLLVSAMTQWSLLSLQMLRAPPVLTEI